MSENERKCVTVAGRITVNWTVELPVESRRESVVAEDPAVEAILEAIPPYLEIHLWGETREPAIVYTEVSEEDVEVEEDERLENDEPENEEVIQDETWWESREVQKETKDERGNEDEDVEG